jgi:hypothetical protein
MTGIKKNCVTCGDALHPERAEKYDYCMKSECRRRNARGLQVVAVGVNKAADQFVLLDERTADEAASGRYKKEADATGRGEQRPRRRQADRRTPVPQVVPRSSERVGPPTLDDGSGQPRAHLPRHGAYTGRDRGKARDQPPPRHPDPPRRTAAQVMRTVTAT